MKHPISRRAFLTMTAMTTTGLVAAACGLSSLPDPSATGTPIPPSGTPIAPPGTALIPLATRAVQIVAGAPDGYIAVAPRVLRAGQTESVSVSLFRGSRPASGDVAVSLVKEGRAVVNATAQVNGRGTVALALPPLPEGDYRIRVNAANLQDETPIRVEDGTILFVETDKPIYKPGQTVHIRVLAVDPTLKPTPGEAVIEVMDAKGIKVFKTTTPIDEFGMAQTDLPLSTEPNLGVWKVQALAGRRTSQVDVRVERYVLPKYEVTVDLAKEWALVSEPIKGTVASEYSFGKPVKGEVEIVASRYVGVWEEYARITRPLDGRLTFEVPPVRYAAGSPSGRGMADVQLEVTVREQATGFEEKTNRLVTIAASPINLRVVPESNTFKPTLPLALLIVAETPDKQPIDTEAHLNLTYQDDKFQQVKAETLRAMTRNGVALVKVTPPARAVTLTVEATANGAAGTVTTLGAGHSPSGSFIHVEQVNHGALKVGDTARFKVSATRQATNFYYEVLSRGKVIFSDYSPAPDIAITLTPLMAPEARLLVYQLLPNAEVAADYLPFQVAGSYPHEIKVSLDQNEVKPGDELDVRIETQGPARVGLAAVDRSVFILAENRLNLQQVFDELERLYQNPQVELHEAHHFGPMPPTRIPGARETFSDAGVVVLSNQQIPDGKQLKQMFKMREGGVAERAVMAAAPAAVADKATAQSEPESGGLAEVQRVRQFFPETWFWSNLTTDAQGRATQRATAPDSITTWMFRAVALSKDHGLGIAEAELRVFQPFFVQVDLPYASIRGEEFPASVALYNYQSTAQEFFVELDPADWFDLLDGTTRTVTVAPNSVGGVAFTIRPKTLGTQALKVTARSQAAADAIIKELIVEPEGVAREVVENVVLAAGAARTLDLTVPPLAIAGSARATLALTGNMLSQTIDGLEGLLQMPFGCGEQNMILFAPNVFIARYLKETAQLKPEVMAKAEKMMLTGYQRQLTYRRNDASFSAFGESDQQGSLWLTAFVLKTFAQARDLIFIDDEVLSTASDWVRRHQNADGSFDPVGFVHHQEMLGGLSGKTALTGFVAVALHEAGDDATANRAVRYLEGQLDQTDDAYALALTTYALALAKSGRAPQAHAKLMGLARESDEGLSWGDEVRMPEPAGDGPRRIAGPGHPSPSPSAAIETTGYAALALIELGERLDASRAVRWLASRRNAFGGFGSTQDTVVALQAMATAASSSRADVDATITLQAGAWQKEVRVTPANADVLQIIEVPAGVGDQLQVTTQGRGTVMAQAVRRFNLPAPETTTIDPFQIDVRYSADQVEVNDLITVTATVKFTPPMPIAAGMVVLDVAVPTGFAPVPESIETAVEAEPKLKRWDVAGRKVILYIEDMLPNDEITFRFQARALYPVRAQAVTSQVYAYYRPEWKGESLGGEMVVRGERS